MGTQNFPGTSDCRRGAWVAVLIHLAAYLSVNALLIVINFVTTPRYHWFWWVVLGWGLGLAFHAAVKAILCRKTSSSTR